MIYHFEKQLLVVLVKHIAILVTSKYDDVLCGVSHEHFLAQDGKLVLKCFYVVLLWMFYKQSFTVYCNQLDGFVERQFLVYILD